MNNNIKKLGFFFIVIFSIICIYLGYLNVILGPKLAIDPHNRRLAAAEEAIVRGTIYDRNGQILAQDQVIDGTKKRVYPQGRYSAHLVGFVSQRYGRTGAESAFDQYLLGIDQAGKIKSILDKLLGRQQYGYDVTLSIDSSLQRKSMDLLNGRKGAVVALEPKSGKILALVSSPSFDPNIVDKDVDEGLTGYGQLLKQTDKAPLLNRATRGIYPPGSVFKIITEAGALELGQQYQDRTFSCEGSLEVDGFILNDLAAHGKVDLNKAIAVSCNTYFASLGLELGQENLKSIAKSFGFDLINYDKDGNQVGRYPVINAEVPFNPGTIPFNNLSKAEIASSAIGQGRVLVSPMQMALVASAVANGGIIMKPSILEQVVSHNGLLLKKGVQEALLTPISVQTARILTNAMVEVVKTGTATNAAIRGIEVAGKTGSAQNPGGQTHAWFIGFAPADEPKIAIAVIVENAGGGSTAAAPIAREIMRQYISSVSVGS